MIGRLRGHPVGQDGRGLVLEVGGVGYVLHASKRALASARGADEIVLETHLHVRDDALELYGFADGEERELFEQLLTVSGVGPKVALAIVSGSTPAELRRAIALDDTARFQAIPGIGKKTAQRVVLELKEKLASAALAPDARSAPGEPREELVAREALVELGYSLVEADQALAATDPELSPEERVREALRAA